MAEHPDDEQTHPRPWRIVTWNLRGSAQPDLAAIAEVIAEQRPDAVALQEVRAAQARTLTERLGWHHRWARKHYPYSPAAWWTAEGHAILSPHRLGPRRATNISPGVHTWTWRHRIVLAADVMRDDRTLRLYDTHLAAHDAPDERIAQAGRVAALIAAERPRFAVAAGDLNAPGEVEVIRQFHPVGLRDPGGGPTNPSIAPRQRLDYVLVPETALVIDQHEPDGGEWWWALSDHVPVTVEFSLAVTDAAAE